MFKNKITIKQLPDIRLVAIFCLGLILIGQGIKFLINETDFSYYSSLFSHLPKKIIIIRFCFSIFLRLFLIITGIGLLLHKNIARKTFIVLGFFTLSTLYWKHPLKTFEHVYVNMAKEGTLAPSLKDSVLFLAHTSTTLNYAFDTLLYGLFMLFLLRPTVKEYFINKK